MKSGDIALATLPQSDGLRKTRPILLIKKLPGFGDWLTAGISSQVRQTVNNWDIPIESGSIEFQNSGLKTDSIIRLSFLATVPDDAISGIIGSLPISIITDVTRRLSEFLVK